MGEKGNKQSALGLELHDKFMEQVSSIPDITSKKMFGGFGIFSPKGMFGMVTAKGVFYLKFNAAIEPLLEKYNSEKHSRMPYWSVPDNILNNKAQLLKWVELIV